MKKTIACPNVDKKPKLGYSINTKGATSRSAPRSIMRSNRTLESGGYFSLLFTWKTRAMTATRNIPNWNNSDHVTISATPFLCERGQKEVDHPRKSPGGTACRGAGSTTDSITYALTKSKQNTSPCYVIPSERSESRNPRKWQISHCVGIFLPRGGFLHSAGAAVGMTERGDVFSFFEDSSVLSRAERHIGRSLR